MEGKSALAPEAAEESVATSRLAQESDTDQEEPRARARSGPWWHRRDVPAEPPRPRHAALASTLAGATDSAIPADADPVSIPETDPPTPAAPSEIVTVVSGEVTPSAPEPPANGVADQEPTPPLPPGADLARRLAQAGTSAKPVDSRAPNDAPTDAEITDAEPTGVLPAPRGVRRAVAWLFARRIDEGGDSPSDPHERQPAPEERVTGDLARADRASEPDSVAFKEGDLGDALVAAAPIAQPRPLFFTAPVVARPSTRPAEPVDEPEPAVDEPEPAVDDQADPSLPSMQEAEASRGTTPTAPADPPVVDPAGESVGKSPAAAANPDERRPPGSDLAKRFAAANQATSLRARADEASAESPGDDARADGDQPTADRRPGADSGNRGVGERSGSTGDHPTASAARRSRSLGGLARLVVAVVLIVAAAVAVRTYIVAPYFIPSASMETTLHGCSGCNNDHVLVNKLSYHLHAVHRGDVVVFNRPPAWTVNDKVLIKRVIGLPGDVLTESGGAVYVNGAVLEEPYLDAACPSGTQNLTRTTVPAHQLFVMGDNRCQSIDSRNFGPIKLSNVIGRAFLIVWPLGRLHYL